MRGFKLIDKYQIDYKNILGQGGMAKVYLGYYGPDEGDQDIRFAVKQISIRSSLVVTDAILQQINLLRKLNHPFILKYIDAKKSPQSLFLILQYCNGGTLEDLMLSSKETFPQEDIRKLLAQIVIALGFLKQEKIIHRDIKPKNILLHNGVIKISDFGVAKMINEHNEEKEVTTFSGTYPFMSPQVLRQYKYTYQTDIWSLGVTLFFMMFRKLPWKGNNAVQIIREIESEEGVIIPQGKFSRDLREILESMLIYDEEERITIEGLMKHPYLKGQIDELSKEYHKQFYDEPLVHPKQITKNQFMIDNQERGGKSMIECERRSVQVAEQYRFTKIKKELANEAYFKLSNYRNHILFFEETLDDIRHYFNKKDVLEEQLFRKCQFLLVKRCYIISNDLHKMLSFGTHAQGNIIVPKQEFKDLLEEKKSMKSTSMRSLRQTVSRLYEKFKNQWLTTKESFYTFQRNNGVVIKNRYQAYGQTLIESSNLILAFNDCFMELFLKFSKGIVQTYANKMSQDINNCNIVLNFGFNITFVYDLMIILCFPNIPEQGNMKAYMDKKKHTRCQQFIYRISLAYKKWSQQYK